jgi:hypothetical protein
MPQIPVVDRSLRAMISHRVRGVERLRRFIGAFVRTDEIRVATNYGSVFQLRPHDYIDSIVLREGYYESEVLDAMLNTVPREWRFVGRGRQFRPSLNYAKEVTA